ncbi:uncharacterized protein BP5553_03781 [Venustampulla echinocandica]|uniref:BZIP domain-containing protein n=1 Tax=Venustampulla echinocandica TaxID=2656787 RepID=A0A370TV94_9HELO|nr:uncharacterized protein BP5553_03781 [Venustampulla echinocandica]RDL39441.1 hypothetical protein BP5553_03781 [Venustampulla echinocandica]
MAFTKAEQKVNNTAAARRHREKRKLEQEQNSKLVARLQQKVAEQEATIKSLNDYILNLRTAIVEHGFSCNIQTSNYMQLKACASNSPSNDAPSPNPNPNPTQYPTPPRQRTLTPPSKAAPVDNLNQQRTTISFGSTNNVYPVASVTNTVDSTFNGPLVDNTGDGSLLFDDWRGSPIQQPTSAGFGFINNAHLAPVTNTMDINWGAPLDDSTGDGTFPDRDLMGFDFECYENL